MKWNECKLKYFNTKRQFVKLLVNLALSLLGLLMQWCSDICKRSDMFWDHCQLYLAGISPVPCSLTYRGFPREPTCLLKPAGSVDERSALEPARPPLPVHALGPWVMTEILPEMQTGKGGGGGEHCTDRGHAPHRSSFKGSLFALHAHL